MSSIAKLVGRLQQVPRLTRLLKESRGLINTTDLLVATAATVVLSAGIGGAAISTLNEAKYGKAQPDATTLSQAITNFYKDTGRWPGQAEQAGDTGSVVLLATGAAGASFTAATAGVSAVVGIEGVAGVADDPLTEANEFVAAVTAVTAVNAVAAQAAAVEGYALPAVAAFGLSHDGALCANNSLEGFVSSSIAALPSSSNSAALKDQNVTLYNLNDYLVRKPSSTDYPNWKGPYVQEISSDPWERAWVAYLAPLYCSEAVTAATGASGNLGYAWLLSGGSNGTITTHATHSTFDPVGDDAGSILSKLITRAAPVSSQ